MGRRIMSKYLSFFVILMLLMAIPLAASAQTTTTEPYSGGGVTETTIAPRIDVLSAGLTKTFTATGYGTDCTWSFGDDSTGTTPMPPPAPTT